MKWIAKKENLITAVVLISMSGCELIEENCDCVEISPLCDERYSGAWEALSECHFPEYEKYTITIPETENCSESAIHNIFGEGNWIKVSLMTNTFTIPNQKLDSDYDIFGSGVVNGDTILMTITKEHHTFDNFDEVCTIKAIWKL